MMSFSFQIEDCALLFGVLPAIQSACPHNLVHHKHSDVMFTPDKNIKVQRSLDANNCFKINQLE
jgi:hypothetical protein